MHLHLPVAILLSSKSQFSLSQPLPQRLKSLGMHAASFSVILHNSKKSKTKRLHIIYRLILTKQEGVYLDFSFCASSNASLRDSSIRSASSSLTFSTASCPSLAERASVRSSTCERSSRNVRSVWDCSEFHRSERNLAWFNSASMEKNSVGKETDVQKYKLLLFVICFFFSCHLVSLLLSGWLRPSPGWGKPLHYGAAGFPDADWTWSDSVVPLLVEEEVLVY